MYSSYTRTITLPHQTSTPYSVIVNRVPRDWHVDTIKPLIAQRYLSTIQVTRMFREGQPINRIRVDFRSNEDVQSIVNNSHIFIHSIRYPAVAYKPLARSDRCFRCYTQSGLKAANCANESKCFKCGDHHEYNRDCANTVKCANYSGTDMAGSPKCPVKTSYRREKRQQQKRRRERLLHNPPPTYVVLLPDCIRVFSKLWLLTHTHPPTTQISSGSSSELHSTTSLEVRCSSSRTSCLCDARLTVTTCI